jgi:hypothetical protein
MPRQARLDAPATPHHILVCGIEKKRRVEDCGIPKGEAAFQVGFPPPKKEQFNIVNYFPWLHNVIHLFGSSKYLRHRGSKANG